MLKLIFPNSIWKDFRLDYRIYFGPPNEVGGQQFIFYEFYKYLKEKGYIE